MGIKDSALKERLGISVGLIARTSTDEMQMWTALELAFESGRAAGLSQAKQAMEDGMATATGGVVDRANAGFEEDRVALEQQFEAACRRHDLTYDYSDDHKVYKRGQDSYDALVKMAEKIDFAKACAIWNKIVDERVVEGSREPFYWTPK